MKAENQHLDFLISQYVDGVLEGAGKKSVEQKMLHDPEARKLYAEHREVQDILDDFGSRIPLVNWSEFDKKLEARLEVEALEKQRISRFRRRLKPVAVAAALLLAVSLGYAGHALSRSHVMPTPEVTQDTVPVVRQTIVVYPESQTVARPSQQGFRVDEPGASSVNGGSVEGLAYSGPTEQVALQALEVNIRYGLGNLAGDVTPQLQPRPGSAVGAGENIQPVNDPDMLR